MTASPTASPQRSLQVHALLFGHYLDPRRIATLEALATNPLIVALPGDGHAAVLRSGAVVLFGVDDTTREDFLAQLSAIVREPFAQPEHEELVLYIDPQRSEGFERGQWIITNTDPERLQVIADILGKSVLLAEEEAQVARAFDRIEPLAQDLQRHGRVSSESGTLLRQIGEALAIQHDMVGRGEIGDKPEVIWERPDLERLFLGLEAEYEIRERQLALERKLTLINDTAATLLDLLHNKRSLHVEWYIVILIVVEIVLTLYEQFF